MQKLILLVLMFAFGNAQGAVENWKWIQSLPVYEPVVENANVEYFLTNDVFEKELKISKSNSGRKVAQAGNDAVVRAPKKLAELVNRINGIKTIQQLDELLIEADKNYSSYADSPDAQFLLAQLIPLRLFRGIFYRMRPLLKKDQSGIPDRLESSGIAHSLLVTFARQMAAGTAIYFPQKQWEVGYKYISEPLENGSEYWVFRDDDKSKEGARKAMEVFQQYLESDVYQAINTARLRFWELAKLNRRMVWDNKVIFASESFPDGMDRYRIVARAECLALYSMYAGAMAGIKSFAAYDMNDLINVSYEMGKTVGFDSMGNDVTGLSSEDRARILNGFPQFLTLRKYNGTTALSKERMRESYKNMKESVRAAVLVWNETNKPADDVWRILDPGAFRPFKRIITESLNTMRRIVDSQNPNGEPVKSAVTGEVVHVKLFKFFNEDPPEDLKVFLPRNHLQGSEYIEKSVTVGEGKNRRNVTLRLRNYDKGRATGWDYSQYTNYFPEATNESGVKLVARVLMQSWGGWGVGIPLVFAVQ